MNVTGSPVKLNNPKAISATTAITTTDCRMRRRMKASKGWCLPRAEATRVTLSCCAAMMPKAQESVNAPTLRIELRGAQAGDLHRAQRLKRGCFAAAALDRMRAACVEGTAGGRVEWRRQLTLEHAAL